jgi:signal transduction histidine kinase
MNFFVYLKDKLILCVGMCAVLAFNVLVLSVFSAPVAAIVVVCLLLFCAGVVALVWDYLMRRRFFQSLAEILAATRESTYLAEQLERPGFTEGRLVYDALKHATKHMNDRIATYHLASEDYQEYIEAWIHEIKTPIAAMRLMLENNRDEGSRALERELERELERIEGFVEQALYYSRSAAPEKDYAIRKVDLGEVVKGVVRKQSRSFIESQVTPLFDGLDLDVYTDPKWLDYIIGQVVTNAVKYHAEAPEGGRTVSFSAELEDTGFETRRVLLRIRDNGIGIPATDVGRVFEKGFTGQNGRLYSKSTGMGLYLCKKLCDKMLLPFSLTSETGKGTTVHLEFPLSKMYFLND